MNWLIAAASPFLLLPALASTQAAAPPPSLTSARTVTVQVRCLSMQDGSLKNCKAIGSNPKNDVAEHLAVQITEQQHGVPPADWPAEGRWVVQQIIMGEPQREKH